MAYKKPQIVAKSAAKQNYVAGCPQKQFCSFNCIATARCMLTPVN